ncbi:MAG: nitronate monooxygenase [Actinomycetaceae bacterium]|nr:nitronate monooxygenase [Actinomycetaceae bacterium]
MFDIVGWSRPLVCAPMAYVGRARLATAVSETGALGMMGFGSADSPRFIDEQFALIPSGLPVGAAFMAWALEKDDSAFNRALVHRPAVICLSFGNIRPWVSRAKDAGSVVLTQVGNVRDIDAAIRAGVDGIVARGMEAGGARSQRRCDASTTG